MSRFHDHQKTRAHVKARTFEAFPKTYGIVHPAEQWASERGIRLLADARAGEGARRRVLRGGRLGAAAVVRGERAARRALRRRAARGRVGRPLVVADHQRRAPRDARARRHLRPLRLRDLRRAGAGRARRAPARGAGADGRPGRARRLHAGARAPAAASSPTSRSCGSATRSSASSPAAPTAWPTASCSATRCPRTARRRSST